MKVNVIDDVVEVFYGGAEKLIPSWQKSCGRAADDVSIINVIIGDGIADVPADKAFWLRVVFSHRIEETRVCSLCNLKQQPSFPPLSSKT